ncbi:MAG: hypothetical protein U0X91_22365 [Spirosomataceae bacterium]
MDLPQLDKTGQIGWFRLHLSVGNTINQQMVLMIEQSGASEIYLNGLLIHQFGTLSTNAHGIKAFNPLAKPVSFPLQKDSLQVLAVRYALQPKVLYATHFGSQNKALSIVLTSIENAMDNYGKSSNFNNAWNSFSIGLNIILCILYFAFYLYYPKQKANLYFSIFCLFALMINVFSAYWHNMNQVDGLYLIKNLDLSVGAISSLFLLTAIYRLFEQKINAFFVGLLLLGLLSIVLSFSFPIWGWLVYGLPFNFLVRIDAFRVAVIAVRKHKKGAWIILIGIILAIAFFTLFNILIANGLYPNIRDYIFAISQIGIPLAVAIYLGYDFALTNRLLQRKLAEVEELSAEKQQILTEQNETLERQVTERTAELKHKNRDLEIEAALDKIRSASLVMRHSHELQNVVDVLMEKLKELGLVFDSGAAIHIFTEGSKDAVIWVKTIDQFTPTNKVNLPYDEEAFQDNPIILDVWQAHETGSDIVNKSYSFEEKNRYFNYVFKYNGYDTIPEFIQKHILKVEGYSASFVYEKHSLLGAASWSGQFFSEMEIALLKRIARVFEQAYVRFLDLQKAEAQAREAQIEAALEKIRSQSLAMHRSEELKDVLAVMFEKLKELDVVMGTVALQFFNEENKNCDFWVSNDLQHIAKVKLPYDEVFFKEDNYMKDCWEAKEQRKNIINKLYSFEQKNRYFDYVFANNSLDDTPEAVREFIKQAPNHISNLFIEKKSALFADNWSGQYYSDDKIDVLKRVAKVFDQAYIRFLDLQKAEAQAREAQVEAALERVRARALAMQHSGEVPDVANTLYEEIQKLGFDYGACTIQLMDNATGDMEHWVAGFEHLKYPASYRVNYFKNPCYDVQLEAWRSNRKYLVYTLAGDEKKAYDEQLFEHNDYRKFPEKERQWMRALESVIFSMAFMKHGALHWGPTPLTEEKALILQRFAAVFEQAYTRFLDLQKAEEQAREAEIELALEKVRSRTMAMHHSSELGEAANLLFQQVQALRIPAWSCGYNIWEIDEKVCTAWMSSDGMLQPPFKIPLTESPSFILQYESRQKGIPFYVEEVGGEALVAHYKYMSSLPDFGEILNRHLKTGFTLPTYQINHIVNFKHGNMVFITGEPVPEAWDIFKRFAKVFEQTYIRFLDLQKAEAQAREAQIEAVLERIRSRAMAMNTSEELTALIGFVYAECTKLNMLLDRGFIMTFDETTKDAYWWMVSANASDMPLKILVKYHEYAPNLAILKGWERT